MKRKNKTTYAQRLIARKIKELGDNRWLIINAR